MNLIAVACGQQRGGRRRRGHFAGRRVELGAAAVPRRVGRGRRSAVPRRRQPRQHASRFLLRHAAPHHHRPRVWPNRLLVPVRQCSARTLLLPPVVQRSSRCLRYTVFLHGSEPLPEHWRRQFGILLPIGTYIYACQIKLSNDLGSRCSR